VRPHSASLSVDTGAFSGAGYVLAGKPARYHINKAAPWSAVKGSHVAPDRERPENSVILPGAQYSSGVGVPLNGGDGFPSEEFAAEYASAGAGEECEFAKS